MLADPSAWDIAWIGAIAATSVLGLVLALLLAHVVVRRMPRDYFLPEGSGEEESAGDARSAWTARGIGRNAAGTLLIVVGVTMLLTPGPGVLALLLGLMLVDFPGRHRLLQRLARRPKVRERLDAMRRRTHREPFLFPEEADGEDPTAKDGTAIGADGGDARRAS